MRITHGIKKKFMSHFKDKYTLIYVLTFWFPRKTKFQEKRKNTMLSVYLLLHPLNCCEYFVSSLDSLLFSAVHTPKKTYVYEQSEYFVVLLILLFCHCNLQAFIVKGYICFSSWK